MTPPPNAARQEPPAFSPNALARIRRQREFAARHRQTFQQLSAREREVLALIADGYSNENIAHRLYLSVHTVRTHRNNVWRQLRIHTVVEAVWWGQCFDLV